MRGKTFHRKGRGTVPELRKRLDQREPDHRKQRLALRQRNAVRPISLRHGADDHVLAVDEGAVAIKDYQFQWLIHESSLCLSDWMGYRRRAAPRQPSARIPMSGTMVLV